MTGVLKRRGEVSQRHGEDIQVKNRGRSCSGAATGKEHHDCQATTVARRGKRVGLSEQIDFKLFASWNYERIPFSQFVMLSYSSPRS